MKDYQETIEIEGAKELYGLDEETAYQLVQDVRERIQSELSRQIEEIEKEIEKDYQIMLESGDVTDNYLLAMNGFLQILSSYKPNSKI